MAESRFEQILRGIQSLPPDALAKLREILSAPTEQEQRQEVARALEGAAPLRDFTADRQWLADHRDEYAGEWVAIENGQLISNGSSATAVHQAANDSGHPDALLVLVESTDAPAFIL